MTIIVKDPLEATSTLCTTTSINDTVDDSDLASTTITGLASTLTSQMSRPMVIYVDAASRFVDSLSMEQLCEMEQKLSEKEKDFLVVEEQIDKPKTLEKKIL